MLHAVSLSFFRTLWKGSRPLTLSIFFKTFYWRYFSPAPNLQGFFSLLMVACSSSYLGIFIPQLFIALHIIHSKPLCCKHKSVFSKLSQTTTVVSELTAHYCQVVPLSQLAVQAEEGRGHNSLCSSRSTGLENCTIGSGDRHKVMSFGSAGYGWHSHHASWLSQCMSCCSRAV